MLTTTQPFSSISSLDLTAVVGGCHKKATATATAIAMPCCCQPAAASATAVAAAPAAPPPPRDSVETSVQISGY
ncbi:MAG TPA: hypothetical protein VFQ53_08130 [Kofleriaceae bacterium]|nr:hypothetical protein [Kofleriaceae bacterium]